MTRILTGLRNRIDSLLPGAQFAEFGDDYDSIDWLDSRPQPDYAAVAAVDPVDGQRAAAVRALATRMEAIVDRFNGRHPATEELSWPAKETAARHWVAATADAADLALLDAEIVAAGGVVDTAARDELAAVIIANGNAYRVIAGTIAGIRRSATVAIGAAVDAAQIEAAIGAAEAQTAAAMSPAA
jgi:hypothetical protein